MGPALNSQTKTVIYNVYKYFRDRKPDRTSAEHRDDIHLYRTVAGAVGVSDRTVLRIVNEANRLRETYGKIIFEDPLNKRTPAIDLDTAIRAKFQEFIKRGEKPTVNKIRIELLEDGVLLCSYDYMKVQLKRLGYRFRPARPRFRRTVERGAGAGPSRTGLQLEHVTVKLEPLEAGHHHHATLLATDDLESNVHIKVEEHEYNDT